MPGDKLRLLSQVVVRPDTKNRASRVRSASSGLTSNCHAVEPPSNLRHHIGLDGRNGVSNLVQMRWRSSILGSLREAPTNEFGEAPRQSSHVAEAETNQQVGGRQDPTTRLTVQVKDLVAREPITPTPIP